MLRITFQNAITFKVTIFLKVLVQFWRTCLCMNPRISRIESTSDFVDSDRSNHFTISRGSDVDDLATRPLTNGPIDPRP